MKSYKEYNKKHIGNSDIARVLIDSWNGLKYLHFAQDGNYEAYMVDDNAEIGAHYKKVAEYTDWLKIYDDTGLALSLHHQGAKYEIYRAGDFGCIIKTERMVKNGNQQHQRN